MNPTRKLSKLAATPAALMCAMLALGLSACSSDGDPWSYGSTYPVVATPDPVAVKLADAADKASKSLVSLAAVEQTRTPAAIPSVQPVDSGDDLAKPMSVSWSGPASPLLIRLATRVGYRYEQLGTPPVVTPSVTVDVFEKPIIEILRDVGMQMGTRAELVVDSNRHVIELRYAALDQ